MLGERLRQLRKWREMTQTRLAQVSGIAQNYISELESGVATNPSPDMIRRLARALGVAEAELTAEAGPELTTEVALGVVPAAPAIGRAALF